MKAITLYRITHTFSKREFFFKYYDSTFHRIDLDEYEELFTSAETLQSCRFEEKNGVVRYASECLFR